MVADEYAKRVLKPRVERINAGLDSLADANKFDRSRAEYIKRELADQTYNWFGLNVSSQLYQGEAGSQEFKVAGLSGLLDELDRETAWMTQQQRAGYAGVSDLRAATAEMRDALRHDALVQNVMGPAFRELE